MKKEINVEIGRRIRDKRESLKLTREHLSEISDLSVQFLAEIELGKKGISPLTIRKLCDALHISADYLIRNRTLSTDFSAITEMLMNLEPQYLPLVEELLYTYTKTIQLKNENI